MRADFTPGVLARRAEYIERMRDPSVAPLPKIVLRLVDGKVKATCNDESGFINALFYNCIEYKEFSSAQSYGTKCEKNLLDAFLMQKVSASLEAGDGFHDELKRVEVKISITDKGAFSFQQIRSWQADYYLLLFCDIIAGEIRIVIAPSAVVKEVVEGMGAGSHSTKDKNKLKIDADEEVEMGLRFTANDFPGGKISKKDTRAPARALLLKLLEYELFK